MMYKKIFFKDKLNEFYNAFNSKEWEKVEECLSGKFLYFTDNCIVKKKIDFLLFMKKVAWVNVNFSLEGLDIKESKDLVVATYRTTFEGVSNNSKMKIHAIETIVFGLEEDKWKILHLHTTNARLL